MYPPGDPPGFYPPANVIEAQTRRNDAAVTYLTAVADNPRKVIGLGGDAITPTVSITVTAPVVSAGQAITATATVSDDVSVTLVAWQVDGQTVAMQTTSPFSLTWTPAAGAHVGAGPGVRRGRQQRCLSPAHRRRLSGVALETLPPSHHRWADHGHGCTLTHPRSCRIFADDYGLPKCSHRPASGVSAEYRRSRPD